MDVFSILVGAVGMLVFLAAVLSLVVWLIESQDTARHKADLADQIDRDFRKRVEFSSFNEKKDLMKTVLREYDREKNPTNVGTFGVGRDGTEKKASDEVIHHPNCHNHPSNRNRQSIGVQVVKINQEALINFLNKHESTTKNKNKSVRSKASTKKVSRKAVKKRGSKKN